MSNVNDKIFKNLFIPFILSVLIYCCFLSGCEAENPGEPLENFAPDTYISEASAGTTTRIAFYATDQDGFVDLFEYKWDSASEWTETVQNEVIFENLFTDQNETKTFQVRGCDNNGLFDPTPAEVKLSPFNVLPETEIINGPQFGETSGEDVIFAFNGKDGETNGSIIKFEYTLDDLDHWQETPSDFPWALFLGLTTGAHVFYVRSVDNLGGKDPLPAQVAFLVEAGVFSPKITMTSDISGRTWIEEGEILEFSWIATTDTYYGILPEAPFSASVDDTAHYNLDATVSLSSGWFSESRFNYIPDHHGLHNFYLKVRDTAGGVTLNHIQFDVLFTN
jgi:hypothetical protein